MSDKDTNAQAVQPQRKSEAGSRERNIREAEAVETRPSTRGEKRAAKAFVRGSKRRR